MSCSTSCSADGQTLGALATAGGKLHFLDPVPIRLVHDRWVSKYTGGWAAGLTELERDLEASMEKVFEIYIRTTPERLWHAITGLRARIEGGNLEVDPPRRLVVILPGGLGRRHRRPGRQPGDLEIEPVGTRAVSPSSTTN